MTRLFSIVITISFSSYHSMKSSWSFQIDINWNRKYEQLLWSNSIKMNKLRRTFLTSTFTYDYDISQRQLNVVRTDDYISSLYFSLFLQRSSRLMRVFKRKIVQAFEVLKKVRHTMKFDLSFEHFFDENSALNTIDQVNSISQQIMTELMNYSSSNEEIIAKNSISQNDSMNIRFIINEKNSEIQSTTKSENSTNIMNNFVDVEQLKRKIILKRISAAEDTESFIMKEFSSSRKKLTLKNLSAKFKKKLKNQALKKLKSSREEDDMNVKINERTYHVEMTIKHLHSCARFLLNNLSHTLAFTKSFIKSTKSTTNKQFTRIFCDIVLDSAKNKIWKKDEHKILTEKSAYLLLLDKRTSRIDFITVDSNFIQELNYHYTNAFDSRIDRHLIWFIKKLFISETRYNKAMKCARNHLEWKIEAHKRYRDECREYVDKRVAWEYLVIAEALNISEIQWSTNFSKDKVLRYVNLTKIIFLENRRQMIQEKNEWRIELLWLFRKFVSRSSTAVRDEQHFVRKNMTHDVIVTSWWLLQEDDFLFLNFWASVVEYDPHVDYQSKSLLVKTYIIILSSHSRFMNFPCVRLQIWSFAIRHLMTWRALRISLTNWSSLTECTHW
jgi:hypothetical protein